MLDQLREEFPDLPEVPESAVPTWLVEMDFRDETTEYLCKAAERAGSRVLRLTSKDVMLKSWLDRVGEREFGVAYGSIRFALDVLGSTRVFPGAYGPFENFRCSRYYPALGNLLVNSEYAMYPFADLGRMEYRIKKSFSDASNTHVFVRPDSGVKPFPGEVLETGDSYKPSTFRDALAELKRDFTVQDSEICLVAPAVRITREYRVVVADRKAVAASRYMVDGSVEPEKILLEHHPEVVAVAEEAARRYEPSRVFTVDVGFLPHQPPYYKVVEINSFSSAGLYCCDPDAVVAAVNRVARDDYVKELRFDFLASRNSHP